MTPQTSGETPQRGEPPGTPARRAALFLLDAVLRKGLTLEAALPAATRAVPRSDDRAFALAIASEALRRLPDLDALIDGATARPLPPDAKARTAMRIALVQGLAMDTPPHAAIATVLALVDGGPRKLVHGVFGTLMREGARLPERPVLPADVAARWQQSWGEAEVEAVSRALAAPPPVDLTLADPDQTERWRAELGGASLMPGHVRIPRGTRVEHLPGYSEGAWWVQDISASLPARLIGTGTGRTALDLCAAPGGKSMQLAAAGFEVTALDASASRLARLRENLARTGLKADVVTADAMEWRPGRLFDAVLLDAPCSATGTFRRHPEILYRARPRVVAELAVQQRSMLARAADWVAPGGTLIFATCSLEREEGEAVIDEFASTRRDFASVAVRAA
jgi:16S rRNA (cytosine967-C5)-methyltransferase